MRPVEKSQQPAHRVTESASWPGGKDIKEEHESQLESTSQIREDLLESPDKG